MFKESLWDYQSFSSEALVLAILFGLHLPNDTIHGETIHPSDER